MRIEHSVHNKRDTYNKLFIKYILVNQITGVKDRVGSLEEVWLKPKKNKSDEAKWIALGTAKKSQHRVTYD